MSRKQGYPKAVVLGAGRVAGPAVDHLAGVAEVVVVDPSADALARLGREVSAPHSAVVGAVTDDAAAQRELDDATVVLSLAPALLHPAIARLCIEARTPMVTASYIKEDMAALDAEARAAGVLLLNECGLDPGIDLMSIAATIDGLHSAGMAIEALESYCGGVPVDDRCNPYRFRASWSSEGIANAMNAGARQLVDGTWLTIPAADLFRDPFTVDVPGLHEPMEAIYNRDSKEFLDRFGLHGEARTFVRGTLRYPGWSEILQAMVDLGMGSKEDRATGLSFADVCTGAPPEDARSRAAQRLSVPVHAPVLDALEWFGAFSADPVPHRATTPFAATVALIERRFPYPEGTLDRVVMFHRMTTRDAEGRRQRRTFTLLLDGQPGGHSAMSITTGLTAALAAECVLKGTIPLTGVVGATAPEVTTPVLRALEDRGIRFAERVEPA